jgi:two-component system, NtrC family, nitrogen regulation sensor histidine kinase NtrY
MNGLRNIIFLFVTTLVFLILSVVAEKLYFSDFEYHFRTRAFNRILAEKETIMEACLNDMKPVLAKDDHHGSVSENNIFQIAEENNITILEYLDNKLFYWSDNEFDVPPLLEDTLYNKPLIFLQNGWFLSKTIKAGNEILIGLLRIRTDYGFTNDIIKNGFGKEFHLSENVGFSTDRSASEYQVNDKNGNFLFALQFPEKKDISYLICIPVILWVISFVIFLFLVMHVVKYLSDRINKGFTTLILLACFSLVYYLILISGKPQVFFITEMFSPYRFTLNNFIPSLGHLLILAILASLFSYVFCRDFPVPVLNQKSRILVFIVLVLFMIAGAIISCANHYLFSQLISTSNINFESYKVLELSWYSISGFISVLLLVLVPYFIVLRIFREIRSLKTFIIIISLGVSLVPMFLIYFNDFRTLIPLAVFWLAFVLTIWINVFRNTGLFNSTVMPAIVFSIYSLYFITILSKEKTNENLKIQAVSFSTENDPEAEHLLLDIWPEISSDTILKNMMLSESFNKNRDDADRISNYISDTYFDGYWGNYNFSIVLCSSYDLLQIGPGSTPTENCFSFFDMMIKMNGHRLTGTEFYFVDNQGGRSNYLGRLFYKSGGRVTNGLFIELYSDVNVFQPGYSELLLDKKYHKYAGLRDYSFAKYINGEIVLQAGEFPFDKSDVEYVDKLSDYRIFSSEGFSHVLYKNGNATVIISRPDLTPGDLLISFAYLFAFVLIFSNIIILLIRLPSIKKITSLNFRQRLQLSFTGILLFSFIMIGVVVSDLTIRQYQVKQNENIKEKLNSVYLELEGRLASEKRLSTDWRNATYASLNEFLIRLSNIFNTDINLYDIHGYLIATSRQEIFYRDLISRRINNMALINMKDFTRSEYFQQETIGKLEYTSAYVPFYNSERQVLAYLNLPYFRMQSILANEISNLIVAVINFTLLLIVIIMSLSVFISGRLTAPLSMLSEGLASVGIGKKSEHLSYKGSDEIGELVRQYNRMVDEIEYSAEKLANSEREYAWREMAKQIAHEIKNPLTPMKLNVQQLLKSWYDKVPGFEKKLESFTVNQIEYIDNLSSIASAFSSFAKMPGNNPVEIDLTDQIRTTMELYKNSDNIRFNVEWPHENKVIVYADKEHLNGIFSNLIKNGMQSIPPDREGEIGIRMEITGNRVIVAISDNGGGISEEIRRKMFTPNFTTKSSGMGLGLSIVKRYVENAGGNIWFESETGKGTTFYVELPVKYTVEKPL